MRIYLAWINKLIKIFQKNQKMKKIKKNQIKTLKINFLQQLMDKQIYKHQLRMGKRDQNRVCKINSFLGKEIDLI